MKNILKNKENKSIHHDRLHIINTKTSEIFITNEINAFSDFERLTKKYGNSCSLFIPEILQNQGR